MYAPENDSYRNALTRACVGCKIALEAIDDLPQETAEVVEEPTASCAAASSRSPGIFPPTLRVARAARAKRAPPN